MKFDVVNKSTTVNRFVLHTLHRNFTHLAVITQKTNKKTRYFESWGEVEKSPKSHLFKLYKANVLSINQDGVLVHESAISLQTKLFATESEAKYF